MHLSSHLVFRVIGLYILQFMLHVVVLFVYIVVVVMGFIAWCSNVAHIKT